MDEKQSQKGNRIKHPMETANFISLAFHCWLIPYFGKGLKKELNEDDMYPTLKVHEAKMLGDKLEAAWNFEIANKTKPSLSNAITKVFVKELLFYAGVIFILELVLRLSQPLLLSRLLRYYDPNQKDLTRDDAYLCSALIVIGNFLTILCSHFYMYRGVMLGMKLRIAACSLIYRKALKLSKAALAETTIGQMVNLLSNDVSRFDPCMQHFHSLWICPLETLVVMCLLYWFSGPTGLVGIAFLILFIPFQMYMAKKTSQFRLRTAIRTDERVRLMNEIISGIQVLKMYTWEKPFTKLVRIARIKEIDQIRATSVIRAIIMSFNTTLNGIAIFLCILTYILTGNRLTASFAYTIASFYGFLRIALTMNFPIAVTQLAEAKVSINRIEKFLLYDEIPKYPHGQNSASNDIFKSTGIYLENVSVKWAHSLPENTLDKITLNAVSNEIIAVVGPVGGGKTTLFHTILKELPTQSGSIHVQGNVSYASQEPWLFGGSVRQNILFGQAFNQQKYNEVVKVCALETDFSILPHGDRTLVGSKGVNLSGGQKARINLARAIYKEADIYLLDDPLSAVDTHVGKHLFESCICDYLKEKCVVLVTHQLQYLRNVKRIYLLENGKISASGSYSELKETESEFTKLLTDSTAEDMEKSEPRPKFSEKIEEFNQGTLTEQKEVRGSGNISWSVYKSYLYAGGGKMKTMALCLAFVASQIAASSTDYFVSIWSNVEQWRLGHDINKNTSTNVPSDLSFSDENFLSNILTAKNAVIIYTCLMCATIMLTVSSRIYFFRYCLTASKRLHNTMFNKIIYAPMKFFNTNPQGRILNRFSKDIGAVDETLPGTVVDTLRIGLSVLAISIVIGSLNPWIFLPTIVILIIFYCLRLVFLATSRDVKRVEAVTRSPIYTHISASLHGLTTIRAFEAQEILKAEFDNYQDKHSAAFFMFLSANRTFGFWLDFHCVVYTALVLISILFVKSEIFGGNVGLALTQSMTLTGMFQWGVRQWSEMENQMTSVERIKEYIDIAPEEDDKATDPPKLWPEHGGIKFVKLSLRYSPEEPNVIKDLTFEIKPKEKIGIVGRTGAGKSSLIAALFRLTDTDGKILIDNVDTKELHLHTIRSKISIIPQEPVLFSGTLRKNLDPFDEYNDEVLWNALDKVELKNAVSDLPTGLESSVSEGGSNFSVGQRQLLCLARAVIRRNRILVMDEATANVDPHTDGLIQTTIRNKFADCTVLTIAHRLHTIMDSDKVLVMDAGTIAEFDHPYLLLKNSEGFFSSLVKQTGKSMAENLISIAETNFKRRNC